MKSEISKGTKFAFIIYPESIPSDWEERLVKNGAPMVVSPLHNLDLLEDVYKKMSAEERASFYKKFEECSQEKQKEIIVSGNYFKKSHRHVIYIAKNPVTLESVRKKIKRALGDKSVSYVEFVDNIEWYYKYLTHESADAIKKKKYKYDKKDLILLNGFDLDRYVTLDEAQKKELFNAITRKIVELKMTNIIDLNEYIEALGGEIGVENMEVLNDVIASKTGLLRLYFDGAYQRTRREFEKAVAEAEKQEFD